MMHGLTVQNINIEQILAPIATVMDECWWFLGGAGMSFPSIRVPARLVAQPHATKGVQAPYDPVDWQRYLNEYRAGADEYSRWIETLGTDRVGKPGFFSRYAAGMDARWQLYFVSDATAIERTGFADAARQFTGVWFDAPASEMPASRPVSAPASWSPATRAPKSCLPPQASAEA